MRLSSFLVLLFTLGTTALGSDIVSTDVQGHPFDKPFGSDRAGGELLAAEVRNPTGEEVEYGDDNVQRNAVEDDPPLILQLDHSHGDGDGDRERRHVNLVIAVPSVRPDRREAIRKSWLKWGDDRVVLRFFTERPSGLDPETNQELTKLLAEESLTHGDIVVQDIARGMNFGLKLLEAMKWMSHHYSFDFFLRLDDDYFLCLDRLLNELSCLIGTQRPPIYAGSRVCREPPFVDEAYILLSSVVVGRILAASDLKCHGFGSLTAAAWLRLGGPGNPQGDVAMINDPRLEFHGYRWKRPKMYAERRRMTGGECEENLGIHRTYPYEMDELWEKMSGKMNVSQSTSDGCEGIFLYEDDGMCPSASRGVDDALVQRLREDDEQPCDSFQAKQTTMWCGVEKRGRPGC